MSNLEKVLVVVIAGEVKIYGYEGRRSKNKPVFQKGFRVLGEVKMIQMIKDYLFIFLQESVHSYIIDGLNSRQNFKRDYKVDKSLTLYQVPQLIDNVLNLFF